MKKIILVVSALSLVGCGSMASVGSSDFSCQQSSGGIPCGKASDIYEVADKPWNEGGVTLQSLNSKQASSSASVSGQVSAGGLSRRSRVDVQDQQREGKTLNKFFGKTPKIAADSPDQLLILNPPEADPTEPMRADKLKQRVWIAPWVSDSGAWHSQQVIFVDISEREWQNGIINSQPNIPIFKPLD